LAGFLTATEPEFPGERQQPDVLFLDAEVRDALKYSWDVLNSNRITELFLENVKMTIESHAQPTTRSREMTDAGAATRFSFLYHHPRRPTHLYDVSIMFNETFMSSRWRIDIRDAGDEGNERFLSSGRLTTLLLKVAVDTLPIIAHITSADRETHLPGRRVYSGWCRSSQHSPDKIPIWPRTRPAEELSLP
jgi:hypothetical protein